MAIDLASRSALLLTQALESIGFSPRVGVTPAQIADEDTRRGWIEGKGAKVISFLHPAHPTFAVDVFIDPPWDFEELFDGSSEVPLGTVAARIASLDHLVEMKKAAGRPEDQLDVQALQLIKERQSTS